MATENTKTTAGILLIILLGTTLASGDAGLGFTPAELSWDVLANEQQTRTIQVYNPDTVDVTVGVEVSDSLADVLKHPKKVTISAGSFEDITIVAKPPKDWPAGENEGRIWLTVEGEGIDPDGSGAVVHSGGAVRVLVDVTNQEHLAWRAYNFEISNGENRLPIPFSYNLANTGNVRVIVHTKMTAVNVETGKQDVENFKAETVLAGEDRELSFAHPGLPQGQYDVTVEVKVRGKTETFEERITVYAPGELRTDGAIRSVRAKPWRATQGELSAISVAYHNAGAATTVKVKGKVLDGEGRVKKVMESDQLVVGEGKDLDFELVIETVDLDAGRYTIEVVAVYGGKVTPPQRASLEVLLPNSMDAGEEDQKPSQAGLQGLTGRAVGQVAPYALPIAGAISAGLLLVTGTLLVLWRRRRKTR